MMLIAIARASLWNRRFSVALTVFTVTISVALLLAVERLRVETRESFASTISGTDLIVGARTGPVQLLLYSVFRMGDATSNIRYRTFEELAALPQIAWAVPIALGDSHRGFRVLGTTSAYFEHFRHGDKRPLRLASGAVFVLPEEAVLGAEVADQLGYQVGDAIVVAHGAGNHDIMVHDDLPFRVSGILERTGTPVDRTVHVSLEGLESIHADWQHGVRIPQRRVGAGTPGEVSRVAGREIPVAASAAAHEHHEHHEDNGHDSEASAPAAKPEAITAVFVGLKNRAAAFSVQRLVNDYRGEPLLAILPAMTLAQLWSLVGVAESALLLVAACVVVAGLLGMTTALVTTLNERRREMAILRALGARPWQVGSLLLVESGTIALLGTIFGVVLVHALMLALAPWIGARFGLQLHALAFTLRELVLVLMVLAGGLVAGIVPALLAYRRSLADGLTIRI